MLEEWLVSLSSDAETTHDTCENPKPLIQTLADVACRMEALLKPGPGGGGAKLFNTEDMKGVMNDKVIPFQAIRGYSLLAVDDLAGAMPLLHLEQAKGDARSNRAAHLLFSITLE